MLAVLQKMHKVTEKVLEDIYGNIERNNYENSINSIYFVYLGISSIKHRPAKATCDKKIRVVHEKNPLTDLEPSD